MAVWRHWFMLAAVYAVLLVGGWAAGQWLLGFLDSEISPISKNSVDMMIFTAAAVFIITSALPFVPGAEIGFGLILVFGGRIAILVYVSMVVALFLAFLVGRLVPLTSVARGFEFLGLRRAHALLNGLAPLNGEQRLAWLMEHAPRRLVPLVLHHRYLALVVLFNLPGNSIIGGGGGIALTAGLSGVFPISAFLAVTALAVAPVPLFFLLTS